MLRKDIIHYFIRIESSKGSNFAPTIRLNSYNDNVILNKCIKKTITYVTVIPGA